MYKLRLPDLREPQPEARPKARRISQKNTPKNKEERTPMGTTREQIQAKITEIEHEMKRIGYWQTTFAAGAIPISHGFALDTWLSSQWLQFIFIPRVKTARNGREVST